MDAPANQRMSSLFNGTTGALRFAKRAAKRLVYRFLPMRFGNRPRNLRLDNSVYVRGSEGIYLGDDVYVGPHSVIKVIGATSSLMKNPDGSHIEQNFEHGRITIGNRVSATSLLHIAAHKEIVIEDDVMIASNVFICDAQHGYEHANLPYKYQGIFKIAPIRVGTGAWIGQNVVVMSGVEIGEYSIIGANSVVTRGIPPKSIAVGAPARVIKRWDEERGQWVAVAPSRPTLDSDNVQT